MKVRPFNMETDYETVSGWFEQHGGKPVPSVYLPPTGLVIEDEDNMYGAVWVYLSGTQLAWIEWLVSNPETPLRARYQALKTLMREAVTIGVGAGCTAFFTSVAEAGVRRFYEKMGFSVTETGMTNMVMRV